MLMLTRLAVGLEPLSVPGAFAPLAPFRPGGIGSPVGYARARPFSRQRTQAKISAAPWKSKPFPIRFSSNCVADDSIRSFAANRIRNRFENQLCVPVWAFSAKINSNLAGRLFLIVADCSGTRACAVMALGLLLFSSTPGRQSRRQIEKYARIRL